MVGDPKRGTHLDVGLPNVGPDGVVKGTHRLRNRRRVVATPAVGDVDDSGAAGSEAEPHGHVYIQGEHQTGVELLVSRVEWGGARMVVVW